MSDPLKHECGIAFLRLRKPQEYYLSRYGSSIYGLRKLYLLMEKQHNRGQDGAGVASIKLDMPPGTRYMDRYRSAEVNPIKDIFSHIFKKIDDHTRGNPGRLGDIQWLKHNVPFAGELFMGHLRYGTFGGNDINSIHPLIRSNNWLTKNLVLAGNFNLTNVGQLFDKLITLGQHPVETTDTVTILEKMGHFLDRENEALYQKYKNQGYTKGEMSGLIQDHLDIANIVSRSAKYWDGGFVISGMTGHGDGFIFRDPSGIRPAYYYQDEEVVVAASERPAIQTAFNVPCDSVKEVPPGEVLVVRKNGQMEITPYQEKRKPRPCAFERIYFSRGTDHEIYQERKNLGKSLLKPILNAINYDLENTVFSFIPNTASVAFNGLVEGLNSFCDQVKMEQILKTGEAINRDKLNKILAIRPRVEQVAVKDVKLRTFITQDQQRDELVAHVYDITYGVVKKNDTLVVLDDSIVRGTTLKESILKILDRLRPKSIVIASSAPQIRYPDCYGIDMAKLNDFAAFRAAIALLKEKKMHQVIQQVYVKCKEQSYDDGSVALNHVKDIYKPFTTQQLSEKIAEILKPPGMHADVQVVYQGISDLHKSCPKNNGDWYFTGDYPTPGGNKVANNAFVNFIEGKDKRAY